MIYIYHGIIGVCFIFILLKIFIKYINRDETVRDWVFENRIFLRNLLQGEKEEKFEGFDAIFTRLPQYSGSVQIDKIMLTFAVRK